MSDTPIVHSLIGHTGHIGLEPLPGPDLNAKV